MAAEPAAGQFPDGLACPPPPAAAPVNGSWISRYGAAERLESCLRRYSADLEATEQVPQRLEAMGRRLGGLAERIATLQALDFSPRTVLRADTRWLLGALNTTGNQVGPGSTYLLREDDGRLVPVSVRDAFTAVYDVRLNFDTSFNGRDLLRVRLRSGNGGFSAFRSNPVVEAARVDGVSPACFDEDDCRNDVVRLDKLFYRSGIGRHWAVGIGPRLGQKDLLGLWPSAYGGSERILSLFDYAGAPGAYSDLKGTGLGAYWRQGGRRGGGWVISAVAMASRGNRGNPASGGLFNVSGRSSTTLQIGYQGPGWALASAWTRNNAGARQLEIITPLAAQTWPQRNAGRDGYVDALSLSGYWQPLRSGGWIPGVSAGWGWNHNTYSTTGPDAASPRLRVISQSWMVGLNWPDAFEKGNELALAIGAPKYV
ncbi:MAG: hypothetical protein VKI83_07445, partial [Synechococcaceae cyanobacterium]|nr:hypothetical protein [Synechococcaceae cyanobacterium]